MLRFLYILITIPIALAATIPASYPLITSAPDPLLARSPSNSPTSCSLTSFNAFTLSDAPGVTYPASKICTCGNGDTAGLFSSVGQDGATTWSCAMPTPEPVSTKVPAPTPTWVVRVQLGQQKVTSFHRKLVRTHTDFSHISSWSVITTNQISRPSCKMGVQTRTVVDLLQKVSISTGRTAILQSLAWRMVQ